MASHCTQNRFLEVVLLAEGGDELENFKAIKVRHTEICNNESENVIVSEVILIYNFHHFFTVRCLLNLHFHELRLESKALCS
jgi:hypothetical protein